MVKPQSTLNKTLKHPLGLIGVVIVGFFCLLSLSGNLITLDKTSQTNLIHLPIALLPPGSHMKVFIVPGHEHNNVFKQWAFKIYSI